MEIWCAIGGFVGGFAVGFWMFRVLVGDVLVKLKDEGVIQSVPAKGKMIPPQGGSGTAPPSWKQSTDPRFDEDAVQITRGGGYR